MAVLTVGLVSLLGVFGLAMASTQTSQQDMIAKQLANEALREYRDGAQHVADELGRHSECGLHELPESRAPTTCGIFLSGLQQMYNAGADGIYGTADDAAAGEETLQDPGPDGIYGKLERCPHPFDRLSAHDCVLASKDGSNNGGLIRCER